MSVRQGRGIVWSWRDVALGVFCLLALWRLSTFVIGASVASFQPDLALTIDPSRSTISVGQAQRALSGDDPEELAAAAARLKASFLATPAAPLVLANLGLLSEKMGSEDVAARLMALAGALSARDAVAHAWLLDEDLKRGDIAGAVARIDLLLRTVPRGAGAILQAAFPVFAAPVALEPLVNVLVGRPAWRHDALGLLARNADVPHLLAIYDAMQASLAPASHSELRPFLERLVREGFYEAAYVTWLQTTAGDRRARPELLYNSRFQHSVSNLPFDWTIRQSPGALVRISGDRGRRTLDVDFFGARVPFRDVSHLMLLNPGDYRFVGMERALSLRNERGLRWRLTCLDNAGTARHNAVLMETPLLAGDVEWRRFAVEFTVPSGCVAQNLVLELAARVVVEQEVSGGVSYMGLGIEERTRVSNGEDLPNRK